MGVNLDRMVNDGENWISEVAVYPLVGTLPGLAKVAIGVIQLISALAYGILFLIPAIVTQDGTRLKHSWTHIKHGLGNIVAGSFEAIPLIGSLMYYVRDVMDNTEKDDVWIETEHERKFMPYDSLIYEDFRIVRGINASEKVLARIVSVKKRHSLKMEAAGGSDHLSQKKKYELAIEALHEV